MSSNSELSAVSESSNDEDIDVVHSQYPLYGIVIP